MTFTFVQSRAFNDEISVIVSKWRHVTNTQWDFNQIISVMIHVRNVWNTLKCLVTFIYSTASIVLTITPLCVGMRAMLFRYDKKKLQTTQCPFVQCPLKTKMVECDSTSHIYPCLLTQGVHKYCFLNTKCQRIIQTIYYFTWCNMLFINQVVFCLHVQSEVNVYSVRRYRCTCTMSTCSTE